MSRKLTLRLQEADARALDTAAALIAGPAGASFVGRMTVIRRALAVFNAVGVQAQAQEPGK